MEKSKIEIAAETKFPKSNTCYKLRQNGFVEGANWAISEAAKNHKYEIWKRNFTAIFISVKFMGIWFEFWSEYVVIGDDATDFFQEVKQKYIKKFKNKDFRMRLIYPNDSRLIS